MKKTRIAFNAPVIISFVGICFVVTLVGALTGERSTALLFTTFHSPLSNPLTYLRMVTHIFGHSGWAHLFGNMTYILLIGPLLEEKYGSSTLLGVMAITAVSTGIINYILFPNVGLLGASGVVFAFILLASFTDFKEGEIPLTFILVAVFFLGQQIFSGLFTRNNISEMAHIVGGIIGGCIGYFLNKRSD